MSGLTDAAAGAIRLAVWRALEEGADADEVLDECQEHIDRWYEDES